MDPDIFHLILLIFALAFLAAIVCIPYMILHKVTRAIVRTTKKTFHLFIDEN